MNTYIVDVETHGCIIMSQSNLGRNVLLVHLADLGGRQTSGRYIARVAIFSILVSAVTINREEAMHGK